MNLKEVEERVAKIEASKDDPEVAHCYEDDLFIALLTAIADGTCEDPKACAAKAITSQDISFPRWCA